VGFYRRLGRDGADGRSAYQIGGVVDE